MFSYANIWASFSLVSGFFELYVKKCFGFRVQDGIGEGVAELSRSNLKNKLYEELKRLNLKQIKKFSNIWIRGELIVFLNFETDLRIMKSSKKTSEPLKAELLEGIEHNMRPHL